MIVSAEGFCFGYTDAYAGYGSGSTESHDRVRVFHKVGDDPDALGREAHETVAGVFGGLGVEAIKVNSKYSSWHQRKKVESLMSASGAD